MPDQDWPAPDFANPEEERQYLLDIIKTGIRFMIFSGISYAVFLWVTARILMNSEIISGSLSWGNSVLLGFSAVVIRVWNSTFFK